MAFDATCVLAAVLFLAADVLGAIYAQARKNQSHFDYEAFKNLEVDYIQTAWAWKADHRPLELWHGIVNSLAWFAFCVPIIKVAWVQSASFQHKKQIGIHIGVAVLALGGSTSELLARLLDLGSTSVMEWMAQNFNLDNWNGEDSNDGIGWRTLEMISIASRGMMLWIDTIEFLFLFGIMSLLYVSVRRSSKNLFSRNWARLGCLIAILSFLDFVSGILRFRKWRTFSRVEFAFRLINHLVCYPIWLLWLARQLSRAEEEVATQEQEKARSDLEMTENASESESPRNEESEGDFV